ncbi:MAG TPA: DUF4214 domain-containing protein [Pyrinomonadaceae bacterium]|nr:DUF4214 domain-containing protein [Pyrinomonadaceae bacterium]
MRLRRRARLTLTAAGVILACMLAAAQTARPVECARRAAEPAVGAPRLAALSLADFAAVGDGLTDDGPALQRALDALAEAGGGTLFVPAGRYAISTPVVKDFGGAASSVSILGVASGTPVAPPTAGGPELTRGLDLTSEFLPRTGEEAVALRISGLESFLIRDVAFVGTPEVATDAAVTLALDSVGSAAVRHCEFYGLSSMVEGGAVVLASRSSLAVEESVFLGSTGASGNYVAVVQNILWKGVRVERTVFADYGWRRESYGKMSMGAPYSWVNVAEAAPPEPASPRREVVVRDVFFDEGGLAGLATIALGGEPAPADLIYVTGLHMNVSNLGASGNYIESQRGAMIDRSRYGWSQNADSAISLVGVGEGLISGVECAAAADRIRADAATGKLTVVNSVYTHLDSLAQVTEVLSTAAPEENPVEYVRAQFEQTAGRAPDAAAHFYWSRMLLGCSADAECLAGARAALAAYLAGSPAETFRLSGRVVGEGGAGLAGVKVELSGSQSVAAVTDADGGYSFEGLPTSGAYVVTPSLEGFVFNPRSRSVENPGADQRVEFVSAPEPSLSFAAAAHTATEGSHSYAVAVRREGEASAAASVVFTASDGTARQGRDVSTVVGRLNFAPGERECAFEVFITDDAFAEPDEQLTLSLEGPEGAELGALSTATLTIKDNDDAPAPSNPADNSEFFVRQHYRDFLNREPDEGGLRFWVNEIEKCGADAQCREVRRINVSAAFFLSIEFQETGFLVYRLYGAAYGRAPRRVEEFLLDARLIGDGVVVGAPGWAQKLEANKEAFVEAFVARHEFAREHPASLKPAEFVARLNERAGGPLTTEELAAAESEFGGAADTSDAAARRRALMLVAENASYRRREFNRAFVLMQYFGYLQRNPDDPPDAGLDGLLYWLKKLDDAGGDYHRAEMVRAFLDSIEFRTRFAP